jgi:hypothetical protein
MEPKVGETRRGNAGKGRKKGVPNKLTGAVKEMVREALDQAGGVDYLKRQAKESPTAFLALVGKLIPAEINADLNHKGNLIINIKRFSPEPDA